MQKSWVALPMQIEPYVVSQRGSLAPDVEQTATRSPFSITSRHVEDWQLIPSVLKWLPDSVSPGPEQTRASFS